MTKITTLIKGITITLTDEQVALINKQTKPKEKYNHYTDIKSIGEAIEYLKSKDLLKGIESDLIEDYYENSEIINLLPPSIQLKLIARAINHLIDNTMFPNWKDTNQYKYYPYHEISSHGGVVFDASYHRYYSLGAVAFTKNRESSDYLGKQFIKLYEQLLTEY